MERLDATMEVLDGKIQEGTARSNANYLSFFEDKSEELYRLHYMYKCLNDLRSNIRKLETPQQITGIHTAEERNGHVWIKLAGTGHLRQEYKPDEQSGPYTPARVFAAAYP